ncbi:hypothetical protein J7K91_01050 [bacterium]|nr:hypothetical protein [bacterium]
MELKASKEKLEKLIGKKIKEIITEGEKILIQIEDLYLKIQLNFKGELEVDIIGPLYEL